MTTPDDTAPLNLPTEKYLPGKELQAFNAAVTALSSLDDESRRRIFISMAAFFGFSESYAATGQGTKLPSLVTPSADSSLESTSSGFSEDRSPSPKQFMLEKKPQTDIERLACLAYYLTHYRDQKLFKTLDLSKLNTEAAQIKFSNAAKAVDNAASAHLLMQAGQGRKQLSALGEIYVEALPDRVAARQAIAELRRRRATPRRVGKGTPTKVSQDEAENGIKSDA